MSQKKNQRVADTAAALRLAADDLAGALFTQGSMRELARTLLIQYGDKLIAHHNAVEDAKEGG